MSARVLVVGGTQFVGRHVVAHALAAGDDVTTLNRGTSGPDHPAVTAVHGDRADDAAWVTVVANGPYDLVVDTCAYVPRVALQSARALESVAGRYVLVSSISVNPMARTEPVDELSPVFECAPDAGPDDGDYGTLKAGCENAVAEVFGDQAVVVRPGIILGPHENVGRLPWWLARMSRGGPVVAPGRPDAPFQAVDGRDLAAFCVEAGRSGASGPFVVTGPVGRDTWGDFLTMAADTTGSDATLQWVPDDVLLSADVEPWTELPLWLPDDPETAHFFDARIDRAVAAGLQTRPLRDTVADTWAWLGSLPDPPAPSRGHGIDPEKERRVLEVSAAG